MVGLTFVSCGDKTDDGVAYTDLTIEQNKAKLQDDGLAVMEQMNAMSNLSAVHALADLQRLLTPDSPTPNPALGAVSTLIRPVVSMSSNPLAVAGLRSIQSDIDSVTMENVMEKIGGTYTYVASADSFTRVAGTTSITILFPIGSSATNDGRLILDNWTVKSVTSQNMPGSLPGSLRLKLQKNGSTLFSFAWTADYTTEGLPTSMTTDFNFVEGYNFTQTATNTQSKLTWEFAYSYQNADILSGSFTANGDFSYDQLSQEVPDENTQDWVYDVVQDGNVWVRLGNVKVTGSGNYKGLMDAYRKAFPNQNEETKSDNDKIVAWMNQYIKLAVVYADENKAIAKSHFYTSEKTEQSWDFNQQKEVTVTYYNPSMQMLFSDGSAFDETFFDEGFGELQQAFMDMQSAFMTGYAQ
jgi:hypothetical protein